MRGHEPILAMRRAGRVPAGVWLSLDPGTQWRTWPEAHGVQWRRFPDASVSADVQVEPSDSIGLLDLRFVVGLTCWVHGSDRSRVERLHQACSDFGARRVLSVVYASDSRGQPEAVAAFDTEGHFAWGTA